MFKISIEALEGKWEENCYLVLRLLNLVEKIVAALGKKNIFHLAAKGDFFNGRTKSCFFFFFGTGEKSMLHSQMIVFLQTGGIFEDWKMTNKVRAVFVWMVKLPVARF